MKCIILWFFLFVVATETYGRLECRDKIADVPNEWLDMTRGCIKEMRRQIQAEINASMAYMAMGAHFSKDTINRMGFAEFFFKASGEEREHAMKLIEYLLMRGQLTDDVSNLITVEPPAKVTWKNGVEALKDALKTEASVTKSIRQVIQKCENDNTNNDYHLVDYLTGEFLEEQYHGQRDLAGKIATLDKMMATQGPLGEFLFDKKLLA